MPRVAHAAAAEAERAEGYEVVHALQIVSSVEICPRTRFG